VTTITRLRVSFCTAGILLAGFLFGLCGGELRAQSTNASVTGYITDPTKAVIVGAKVIVINVDTNGRYESVTNNVGSYDVPALPPGRYRIEVEKPGFKTVVKSDLILHVQDTAAINFEMALGSASEIVTVEAGGLVINTTDATVATVIDRNFAENLPLNGRSFQTLIELTPGVVLTQTNSSELGQFSVNGQRTNANYFMVDGVSANVEITASGGLGQSGSGSLGGGNVLGGTNSLVPVDALEEFRIETSSYAPEFGRTPGAQISLVTRAGTNNFHGSLFEYFRNDVLDANDWFSDEKGLRKSEERQNDFGGVLGGRIVKDKTFFFFSYEGLRLRLPQTTLANVPCDSTCTGFGNARTMAPPAIQPYINAFPLPNGPEVFRACTPNVNGCPASGLRPTGLASLNAGYSNPATVNSYGIRVDHRVNSKLSIFGRYANTPSELSQRAPCVNCGLNLVQVTGSALQAFTVGATWTLTPGASNDFRFNFSRATGSGSARLDGFGGASVPPDSSIFPAGFSSADGQFVFTLTGFGRHHTGWAVGKGTDNLQRQYNFVDSLSLQRSRHSLKLGVDYRRLSPVFNVASYGASVFFANVQQIINGTLNFGFIGAQRPGTWYFTSLGAFAQDSWKATPRLTITYGLRWDLDLPPTTSSGVPLLAATNFNDLANLSIAPLGTALYKTTFGGFAPRGSVAYALRQAGGRETVVRGGFGVFYDLRTQQVGDAASNSFPFGAQKSLGRTAFPLSPSDAQPPAISSALPINTATLSDPNLKLPYTLEWNASLQQALGTSQAISLSYVGASGRRLIQVEFIPGINQNITGNDELIRNGATSNYNALQLQFNRRLSRGLQVLAGYTWAHSIDTGSTSSGFGISGGGSSNLFVRGISPDANRGSSDFDIRHSLSAGFTYDLPTPYKSPLARTFLNGWEIDSILLARSAPPVSLASADFSSSFANTFADVRPDVVPGVPQYLYSSQFPGGKAINPAALTDPPADPTTGLPLRQGTLGRNALRGFGATQWDFAVSRKFTLRESMQLQFRAELFNILNHPNFATPSSSFSTSSLDPLFGQATMMLNRGLSAAPAGQNTGLSPLYQIGGPRSVQLALKLVF
jgi:hypothetical protein